MVVDAGMHKCKRRADLDTTTTVPREAAPGAPKTRTTSTLLIVIYNLCSVTAHVELFDVEVGLQYAVELHLHARRRVDGRVVAGPGERELTLRAGR